MLRRLPLGLFALACAAAVAACSSGNTVPSSGGVPGKGPNFATNTLYVSDTTINAIDIYTPAPGPSATPQYQIGGGNTSMNGPAYLAFDSSKNLFVTNYNASSNASTVTVYKEYATGNVLPFGLIGVTAGAQAHGISMLPKDAGFVIAFTAPGSFFQSGLSVYGKFTAGTALPTNLIAGSSTGLSNPIGVAVDSNSNIYAANSGGANVTVYTIPSPTPTPSGSPSPSPSPTATPTAVPSGQPTATPSPTPTPFSENIPPTATIACSCFKQPTGVAVDASNDLFVTDPGVPAVYVFTASQIAPGGSLSLAPSQSIAGNATMLVDPTDVKIDGSGNIYVLDAGSGPGTSKVLIFAPGATGNVAPTSAVSVPTGTATGLALSP